MTAVRDNSRETAFAPKSGGWTALPTRRPWLVILAFLLAALLFALPAMKLEQIADVSVIVDQDLPELVTKNALEQVYGDSNFVVISASDTSFEPGTLKIVEAVTSQLEAHELVRRVNSVFNTQHITGSTDSFEVDELTEGVPSTPADISALRDKLQGVPSYIGNLVSLDGRSLGIMVEFVPGTRDETMSGIINEVLTRNGVAETWAISGLPIINTQVKSYMDRDFRLLLPLFFVFITIVLFLSFRSARGIFVPLMNIIFSIVIAMGAMAVVGIPLNVITNVIPMILVAITSSYGIHYLNHFYIENTPGREKLDVIRTATTHIMRIVFLSGFTTFIAFMANAYSDVKAVREFGIFVAIGVAAAVLATLVLSPAILSLMRPAKPKQSADAERESHSMLSRSLAATGRAVVTRPALLSFAVVVVVGFFVYKIPSVEADYTALGYFDPDTRIVDDAREISKSFGGFNSFDIDVDTGEEDGVLSTEVLGVLEAFKVWISETYPDDVKVVISFSDYVSEMNKAYNGGDPAYYAIPESDDEIYQYVEIYSWSGDIEEDFRNIVTPDYRRTHINGRFALKEFDDGSFEESSIDKINDIINAGAAWLRERLPEGVKVQPYGVLPMWKQVQVDIIEGQFYAIAIAMTAILVVLTLVFRSLAIGLISLTPVATAVAGIFGLMGWMDVKLEIGTSLVAAMAIGIGIDDTMYFLLTYRKFKGLGQACDQALLSTFEEAGKAIMYTSFALMAGYSILLLSKFKVIQYFAMLNFAAIVATTIGALVVLPLILRVADTMTAKGVVKVEPVRGG